MKLNKKIILIFILILIVLIVVASIIKNNSVTSDEKKFKQEYEIYNNKKNKESGKVYPKVDIPKKNKVVYATSKQVKNLLTDGTGIIYFGFPECPWCRSMISTFLETTKEKEEKVYYYNAYSIRDEKSLDKDGNIVVKKEGTNTYKEILKLLGDNASVYEGLEDDSIKRLYFPTVVFVKNGEIVDIHVSTVESQKDPYKKLNKKQIEELEKIYKKGIKKLKQSEESIVCTGKDSC